jgi:hypothetical protein
MHEEYIGNASDHTDARRVPSYRSGSEENTNESQLECDIRDDEGEDATHRGLHPSVTHQTTAHRLPSYRQAARRRRAQ